MGAVKSMNHVTVFVPNVQKAVDFYQGLFGMPILTKQDAGINLSTGTGFYGIYPAQNATTGSINHVCFGMENFDADAVLEAAHRPRHQGQHPPARRHERAVFHGS